MRLEGNTGTRGNQSKGNIGERGHWGPDLKLVVKGTLFQEKSLIRMQMPPPLLLMTRDDSRKKPAPRKQASAHPLRSRSRWVGRGVRLRAGIWRKHHWS